jgi:hypothetical protein
VTFQSLLNHHLKHKVFRSMANQKRMFMLFAVSVKAWPRLRVFCMEKYVESLQITHTHRPANQR